MKSRPIVLVVDDSPDNLRLLGTMLEVDYDVRVATNGPNALHIVASASPDIILLDVRMPGMDGYEVCRMLKADEHSRHIPIIFISALDAHDQKMTAFSEGAVDYITKPFQADEVTARVRTHLQLSNLENLKREMAERERVEEELRRTEARERLLNERFSLAVESAGIGVWDLDIVRNVLTWDAQMYRIYGVSPEEFTGVYEAWERSVHPDDLVRARREVQRAIDGEADFNTEFRLRWPNGEVRHIKGSARVIRNERDEAVRMTGINYDISDQKRAEEQREELQAQLRHIQKMEAIGVLAGGIAHDFNNILAAIVGHAELLQHGAEGGGEPDWSSLDEILHAASRATGLVRQILTFSRRAESRMEPIQLGPIALEAIKLLRGLLPSNVVFEQENDFSGGQLLGDANHLHQIIMNLCTNAVHAIGEQGGTITVSVRELDLKLGDARLPLSLPEGPYMELAVRDSGCGIPPEHIERIFEPFFTSKELGKGTGLGLAVVHGIVLDHGGAISVESEVGRGSLFRVLFPRVHRATDINTSQQVSPPRPIGHGRILVVDDEESILRVMSAILQSMKYEVVVVNGAEAAYDLIAVKHEVFDLVFTDYMMPNMTGPELRCRLLEAGLPIRMVLVTGYNDTISLARALEMGFEELLLKPMTMQSLADCLQRLLG